jgi:hypothetical protein
VERLQFTAVPACLQLAQIDCTSACMQIAAEATMKNQKVLKPPVLRALHEAADSGGMAEVAYVATTEELQAAVDEGARHIQITQHLDLTAITVFLIFKIDLKGSTLSIRVCLSCPRST